MSCGQAPFTADTDSAELGAKMSSAERANAAEESARHGATHRFGFVESSAQHHVERRAVRGDGLEEGDEFVVRELALAPAFVDGVCSKPRTYWELIYCKRQPCFGQGAGELPQHSARVCSIVMHILLQIAKFLACIRACWRLPAVSDLGRHPP